MHRHLWIFVVICFVTVGDLLLLDLLKQLSVSELVRLNLGRRILLEDFPHVTEQLCHALNRLCDLRSGLVIIRGGGALICG